MTSEFLSAVAENRDAWVPACGGAETPFRARSGATLLYCFNPALRQHAYLLVGSDLILSNEEAAAHMQMI
jgi:hypothetical protein